MKKIYYKIAILFTAFFVSCTDTEMVTTNDLTTPVTSIPADACRGESSSNRKLLIYWIRHRHVQNEV